MALYGWNLQYLAYVRAFIVMMFPLKCYLLIKSLLFIALLTWLVGTLMGTSQKIMPFTLETWLYVCSSNFIVKKLLPFIYLKPLFSCSVLTWLIKTSLFL